jgi:hypothetical protein
MSADEPARAHSEAIRNKARFWLDYIEQKRTALNAKPPTEQTGVHFEYAATWFLVFAYINWLACFYFVEDWIKTGQIDDLFHTELGWPSGLGRVFWKAARNPLAHVSQSNPFHSYAKFEGRTAYLQLDFFQPWTEAQPPYLLLAHPTEEGSVLVVVTYDGLKPHLEKLAHAVAAKIENASPGELPKIVELNAQIPH